MKVINVQEAKTHLSRLIEEAAGGESILIANQGNPRVKLSPNNPQQQNRPLGGFEGRIRISDDFDVEDARVEALFHG